MIGPPVIQTAPAGAIRVSEWNDGRSWDRFVEARADSTIMHRWAWREVLAGAYRLRSYSLAAEEADGLVGVLPLALIESRLLGRHLVSMPFMDYGGACATSPQAERALVDAAIALASTERAVLELRYAMERPLELPESLEKVTMVLELGGDEQELWRRLPSERRNRIRKGQRLGLTASVEGAEALPAFYSVLAANMRDLGSPVHSVGFFREILEHLEADARLLIVRSDAQPIGAALMLFHAGSISIPWVSSRRDAFAKCPNQVLYWEAMAFGIRHGFRTLDFGRSSKGSGTYEAKRQWGAEPVQLHWHYHPPRAKPPSEEVQRVDWMGRIWRRIPLRLANAIGPRIRRAIPN
jgi:serine/alanine adding enzyme